MNQRRTPIPILTATVCAFVATSLFSLRAEPGVPSDDTTVLTPIPASAPKKSKKSSTKTKVPTAASVPATPSTPQLQTQPSSTPTADTPPSVSILDVPIPAPTPVAASAPVTPPAEVTTLTYKVKKGDSFRSIADEYGCTVAELKKYNHITAKSVLGGQVLNIPPTAAAAIKPLKIKSTKKEKAYAKAQPVQDFDVPASTFASCPVPLDTAETDVSPASVPKTPETPETVAPVAKLVSPSEMPTETETPDTVIAPTTGKKVATVPPPVTTPASKSTATPLVAKTVPLPKKAATPLPPAPDGLASDTVHPPVNDDNSADTTSVTPASSFSTTSSKQPNGRALGVTTSSSSPSTSSNDWAVRFIAQARALGDRGIGYNQNWRPPGEARSWPMDCSNTSRYLYRATAGISLPRTASDQYYYLHLQNKAWDVPQASNGFADCNYLRRNLKPGDLLFWENTYRPERQPPITHVMIFLGTNEKGDWIMAGSQSSRGGEHNRRRGGPDIYVFDPTRASGGYTTWLGLVRHQGRFCAYGRPLEADPSKLSVATNN